MIKTVSISQLSENSDQLRGSVVMELVNAQTGTQTRAQFLCRVRANGLAREQQLVSLARDALRQARRLPDCADLTENEAFQPQNITLVA